MSDKQPQRSKDNAIECDFLTWKSVLMLRMIDALEEIANVHWNYWDTTVESTAAVRVQFAPFTN